MNERTERETGIRIRIRKNRERNWDKDREGSFIQLDNVAFI